MVQGLSPLPKAPPTNMAQVIDNLKELEQGNYYTILGVDSATDYENGYKKLLYKEGIGQPERWVYFNGQQMNAQYQLIGEQAYPEDLGFLAFPLNGLDLGKLAIFRLRMGDSWFKDIVDNNDVAMGRDVDVEDEE